MVFQYQVHIHNEYIQFVRTDDKWNQKNQCDTQEVIILHSWNQNQVVSFCSSKVQIHVYQYTFPYFLVHVHYRFVQRINVINLLK